jgi:SPP1 gp7 family putative phage head morphogenesis protein
VVFEVERGAKAVGISRFSNWNQAEAITKGRFEVTQVTKDSARGTMRVGLRQVASHSLKQLVQNEDLSASFAEFYPSLDLEWYGKESSGTDPAELFVIVAEVEREMSKEGVEASEQEPEAKSAEFPTPERRSLWEKVTKRRAASEKRLISKLSRVLNDVRVETLANIEKADLDNAKMLETKAAPVDVVFRFDPFLNQWTKVTRAASTEMLTESVEETRSELEEELNLDEPSAVPVPPQSRNPWKLPPEKAMQFLQERENLMKGIADEIHKEIMDSIAQGMADGIGAAGIAESVKKKFNEISNGRAKTIARTETGAAYGFARQASLEATTIQYKQWLATPDARCRPSHVAADGQVVPMNVPFKVGGASLMYPCDPSGPLDEIINCRCVQLAVVRP